MYLFFFLTWIVFNGKITGEIVVFGIVISTALFAFMCKFMDYSLQKEKKFYARSFLFLAYLCMLVKEIFLANLMTMKLILSKRENIHPVIVRFRTSLKDESARVLLANSITLTPGTITVHMEKNELVVHCLDKRLAKGIEESVFVKALEKIYGEESKS